MQQRPPIYLVCTTAQETEVLQTVLHFIGESYLIVKIENLQDKVNELNPLCVISGSENNNFDEGLKHFPKTAFISLSGEVACVDSNHIGVLNFPIVYSELTQLLHICQAFLNPAHKLSKVNKFLISSLVGKGSRIQEIRYLIEQVADSNANVLILGESGTGKEVVARSIHEVSSRNKGPFVPVNCGAIPAELHSVFR